MDDSCLRFLGEEKEDGRWSNVEQKRERKGHKRRMEREKSVTKLERNGKNVKKWR